MLPGSDQTTGEISLEREDTNIILSMFPCLYCNAGGTYGKLLRHPTRTRKTSAAAEPVFATPRRKPNTCTRVGFHTFGQGAHSLQQSSSLGPATNCSVILAARVRASLGLHESESPRRPSGPKPGKPQATPFWWAASMLHSSDSKRRHRRVLCFDRDARGWRSTRGAAGARKIAGTAGPSVQCTQPSY